MLLEGDASWKDLMSEKIRSLEDAIGKIAAKCEMPDPLQSADASPSPSERGIGKQAMSRISEQPSHVGSNWEVMMDPNIGPAAIPASVVSPPSAIGPHSRAPGIDLVTRGIVSMERATALFKVYNDRLDHFVYRILGDHDSLSSVRASSSLLTAAICAVGALHSSPTDFEPCYQELLRLISVNMFCKRNTFDDVRALCIAAFWLTDISWTLVGAGRIVLFKHVLP